MARIPSTRAHPHCWTGDGYKHVDCLRPSGRTCIEAGCDQPAGTRWGRAWCPDCDVVRLERISSNLEAMADELRERS